MFKDRAGNEITVGTKVAYNLSGEVAIGTVEKITDGTPDTTSGWRQFTVYPVIFIRPDAPWVSLASQRGLSKVTVNYPDLSTKVVVV